MFRMNLLKAKPSLSKQGCLLTGAVFLGLSVSVPLSPSAEAQTQGKGYSGRDRDDYVGMVEANLRKSRNAKTLNASQLSNYLKFKTALSHTVKRVYAPLVVEVDNGLVDGILKPLYKDLLYTRFRQDRNLRNQARLSGAKLIISFSNKGKITFADAVGYIPLTIKTCVDKNRSSQIPCAKTSKQLSRASKAFARKPDKDLMNKVKSFKINYAKSPSRYPQLSRALKGQPVARMGTLQLASVLLAASPGTSTRAGEYYPPAFWAYKKIPGNNPGGLSRAGSSPNVDLDVTPGRGIVQPGVRLQSQYADHLWLYTLDSYYRQRGLIASESPSFLFGEWQSIPSTRAGQHTSDEFDLWGSTNLAYAITNNGKNTNYQLVNGFTVDKHTKIGQQYKTKIDWGWFGTSTYKYGWTLNYSYLYGVRAAFDVNTTATLTNKQARSGNMLIKMSTGNKNAAIFQGAFPSNKQGLVLNGRELLAELCHKGCSFRLWGDVPGPDPLPLSWNVGKKNLLGMLPAGVGQIKAGHFNWPNVGGKTNLGKMVAPVDLLGGAAHGCVIGLCVGATAKPYVVLDARGLRYRQLWAKNNGNYQWPPTSFQSITSNTSTLKFNFHGISLTHPTPVATGVDNRYSFDFELTPGLRFNLDLIVTDYSYDMDIPALAIDSPDITLYRHKGSWNGAWTSVPK